MRRRKILDMPVQLPVRHKPSVWLLRYARCVVHDYAEVLALVGARYSHGMERATTALAVQQSHAQDYAEFVPFMRARYNCSGADPDAPTSACPVVLFGGSYGGSAPASC